MLHLKSAINVSQWHPLKRYICFQHEKLKVNPGFLRNMQASKKPRCVTFKKEKQRTLCYYLRLKVQKQQQKIINNNYKIEDSLQIKFESPIGELHRFDNEKIS